MRKRMFCFLMIVFPLMSWAGKQSGTRAGYENHTQDFVTDTINGFYYLDYFNCDMFVDKMAFNIISKEDRTVELTQLWAAEMYGDRWIYRMDTMRIPETVTWHDTVYTVKAIGPSAFCYSEIKHLEIPQTVTEIKRNAFTLIEELEELVIPESVTTIGDFAFAGTQMVDRTLFPKRIVFPQELDSLGIGLFYARTGDYIPLPDNISVIPSYTYGYGGLSSIPELSENIETISEGAFCYNDFEEISLPENLKVIGEHAFYNCRKLKTVTIPASVISIGAGAFGGDLDDKADCVLDTMRMLSVIPPLNNSRIDRTVLIVPDGTKEQYQQAWNITSTILEESEVTAIRPTMTDQNNPRYYSINGQRMNLPKKGISIIRRSDGTTRKEIVR